MTENLETESEEIRNFRNGAEEMRKMYKILIKVGVVNDSIN